MNKEPLLRNSNYLSMWKNLSEEIEKFRPVDSSQYAEFYEQLIFKVLESSESNRTSVGQLFYKAVLEKKVDIKHLTDAFKSILANAEDMAIDIPKIATYLSQLLAPLVNKEINLEFLSIACEQIKNTKICAEFIVELLRNASNLLVIFIKA